MSTNNMFSWRNKKNINLLPLLIQAYEIFVFSCLRIYLMHLYFQQIWCVSNIGLRRKKEKKIQILDCWKKQKALFIAKINQFEL